MKCICPKCHGCIDLDLDDLTEAGSYVSCPACKTGLTAYRESFATRGSYRSANILCASCGSALGPDGHCPACGIPFPDFIATCTGRKAGKASSKRVKFKSRSSKKTALSADLPSLSDALNEETPQLRGKEGKNFTSGGGRNGMPARKAVLAAGLVVVLAAVGGGGFYLNKLKEERYLKNFVLASYCIQSGEDGGLAACKRVIGEWKAKADAGQAYRPRLTVEEDRQQKVVARRLEEFKDKMADEPEKFAAAGASLARLGGSYTKLRSLLSTPGNSLQTFADSTNRLEAEYASSAKEFKSGLPVEARTALEESAKQFKGLRPLLK